MTIPGLFARSITPHLKKVDSLCKECLKYVGMVKLLKAIFTKDAYNGGWGIKTWEESLREVLDTLSLREKEILVMRFGLDNAPATLEKTGIHFGVTKERIRQIEARALRKLKHPSRRRVLLGESWQMAVQESKAMGLKLLLEDSKKRRKEPKKIKDRDLTNIELIDIPTRVSNTLRKGGLLYVYQVEEETDENLMKLRNIGQKCVEYIRRVIRDRREKK